MCFDVKVYFFYKKKTGDFNSVNKSLYYFLNFKIKLNVNFYKKLYYYKINKP